MGAYLEEVKERLPRMVTMNQEARQNETEVILSLLLCHLQSQAAEPPAPPASETSSAPTTGPAEKPSASSTETLHARTESQEETRWRLVLMDRISDFFKLMPSIAPELEVTLVLSSSLTLTLRWPTPSTETTTVGGRGPASPEWEKYNHEHEAELITVDECVCGRHVNHSMHNMTNAGSCGADDPPSSLADATSPSALSEHDFIEDYWSVGWRDFDPKWGRMQGESTPALFHRLFPAPTPAALPASSPKVGREDVCMCGHLSREHSVSQTSICLAHRCQCYKFAPYQPNTEVLG